MKKARKRKKISNEDEEDPERLARTVFVGNLPVAFTRKVSKPVIIIINLFQVVLPVVFFVCFNQLI